VFQKSLSRFVIVQVYHCAVCLQMLTLRSYPLACSILCRHPCSMGFCSKGYLCSCSKPPCIFKYGTSCRPPPGKLDVMSNTRLWGRVTLCNITALPFILVSSPECPFMCLCLWLCLCLCLSVCLSVRLTVCLCVCVSVCSVCSVCLCVCLSVCLCLCLCSCSVCVHVCVCNCDACVWCTLH
jgi:hypothetical protein